MGTICRQSNQPLLIILFVNALLLVLNRPYVEGIALLGSVSLSIGYIVYSIKKNHDFVFFLLAVLSILGVVLGLAFLEHEATYLNILIILIVFIVSYTLFSLIFTRERPPGRDYTLYNIGVFFALINLAYGLILEPGENRFSGIYQNTLNFTGSMCMFYSASFYNSYTRESHLKTLFLVLLISLVAILSESKSIGLTILVSLFFYIKYLPKPSRYLLIMIFALSLIFINFDYFLTSGSNQLRIDRYMSTLDFVRPSGIGLEAFSSLSKYTGVVSKGIFESFMLSLFLFSPIYFLLLSAMIFYKWIFKSEFYFNTPKILFMVTPIFAGSLLTPVTLLNALILLFSINCLFYKRV
jgi:hypothetical protein